MSNLRTRRLDALLRGGGGPGPVLSAMVGHRLVDVAIGRPSLEESFVAYYGKAPG